MARSFQNSKKYNLFTEIDFQIMLCKEKIRNYRRSIEKTKRMCGWQGPKEIGGVDYSRESMPSTRISFIDGLRMIQKDERQITILQEELKELRRSRRRVKKIYENLTGYEEQIYYYRVILKKTQQATADEMAISVRQLQRIESSMKDKGLF